MLHDDEVEVFIIDETVTNEDDGQEEISIVTPASSTNPSFATSSIAEATPEPSYLPDTLLLAENQVNGLALQTALTGLVLGFLMGVEVLKIWLTGSR